MRHALFLLPLFFLGACKLPGYQPELLFVPAREGEQLLRSCIEPLHSLFPRIRVVHKDLLVTDWISSFDEEGALKRRLEIAARPIQGGTLLMIAVHRMEFIDPLLSDPSWVDGGGDRAWEDKVAQLLKGELDGKRVGPSWVKPAKVTITSRPGKRP